MKIHAVTSREVLDSRGNPTISASCELEDGVIAEASVPSGASTGTYEAKELRDKNPKRFLGKGELLAVSNVNSVIGPALIHFDGGNQKELDKKLCELDGSHDKSNLGANAILAVSLANARAQAISTGLELFQYLGLLYTGALRRKYTIPTPMFNVLNGGAHAKNNVDMQETMIVPVGLATFEEKLRAGAEIYYALKNILINKGYDVGLGDEGGFAPNLDSNEEVFELLAVAISEAGYLKNQVRISVDVAASELLKGALKGFNPRESKALKGLNPFKEGGQYHLHDVPSDLSSDDMVKKISGWAKKYNLLSVEDGLDQDDPLWGNLTKEISPTISIGDDLFTTNPARIEQGVKAKIANGVIIKPNQIGTLTETFEAIKKAKEGKFSIVVSHRSGETEDPFIADLAVAVSADFIKAGAPARSERLAKYNRLSKIEDVLLEFSDSPSQSFGQTGK